MTAEPEDHRPESDDVRAARRAVEEHLARTADEEQANRWRETGRVDDRVAEEVARAAWDAVQEVTPPPPSPQAGPAERAERSPERAERHRRAVAVARGLRELGHSLDETLLPGLDMAAG
ncbi:hypothetical protein AB0E83_17830 [Streptomyces sp. NPDC035033]|uniref:hypothetical protein n=1 Tax=Streptomyces sp. NPDC035033 TaxID=3155368 RepID=UPI0033D97AC2